jgi:hypothetical protein
MNAVITVLLHLKERFPVTGVDHYVTLGGVQGPEGRESTLFFNVWVRGGMGAVVVPLSHLDRMGYPEPLWPAVLEKRVREATAKL